MKERVLSLLKKNDGRFLSGQDLSVELGVSRTAIWKYIQALQSEGYIIEAHPRLGYKLLTIPDLLLPYEIEDGLKTNIIGKKIHYFKSTTSTNDIANNLASKEEDEGTIVVAEEQTRGKGRLGREWFSPPYKGIYISIILRPNIEPAGASIINMITALSAAMSISAVSGLFVKVKWPNDILINRRKVGGVLTEIQAELDRLYYVITGLGINVNTDISLFPMYLHSRVTSIKNEWGKEVSRLKIVQIFLEEFERRYIDFCKRGSSSILDEWKGLDITLGSWVNILFRDKTYEGKSLDVDENGALIVKLKDGKIEKFIAGDVSLL